MKLNARNYGKCSVRLLMAVFVFSWLGPADAKAGGTKIALKNGKASISGNLTAKEELYTIAMAKGKIYAFSMTSTFDTYLRLRDKNGVEIAKDDDGGNGLNALLVFQSPESATYTIVATSFIGSGRGAYALDVNVIPIVAFKNNAFSLNGKIEPGKAAVFAIKAKQGEKYVIDVMSTKFDTFLAIRDTKQSRVAFNDDGGEGLNSRLEFMPTADGYYFVCPMSLTSSGQGEYQFSIVRKAN